MAWDVSPSLLGRALAFGLPDVPRLVSWWALRLADRMILQAYAPLAAVGVYSVGYTLGSLAFDLIATGVNSATLPFFFRTAREEPPAAARRVFAAVAAYNAALLGFLALGTILFAREAIVVLASTAYLAAGTVVPYVAWASVFQALAHVPTRAIYLAGRTAWLPLIFVVPGVVNVGLNLALVPAHGLRGAAWATLAAYPVLFGLSLVVAQRVYPIPYDYRRMAKPLALALVLSLAPAVIPAARPAVALALKAGVLALFPAVLLASGFVTPAERRALGAWVARAAPPGPSGADRGEVMR